MPPAALKVSLVNSLTEYPAVCPRPSTTKRLGAVLARTEPSLVRGHPLKAERATVPEMVSSFLRDSLLVIE
jgi:hypothetical protein